MGGDTFMRCWTNPNEIIFLSTGIASNSWNTEIVLENIPDEIMDADVDMIGLPRLQLKTN